MVLQIEAAGLVGVVERARQAQAGREHIPGIVEQVDVEADVHTAFGIQIPAAYPSLEQGHAVGGAFEGDRWGIHRRLFYGPRDGKPCCDAACIPLHQMHILPTTGTARPQRGKYYPTGAGNVASSVGEVVEAMGQVHGGVGDVANATKIVLQAKGRFPLAWGTFPRRRGRSTTAREMF